MDTLNNIRPGDRINISFSDSKVNKNNYKSSISDLISDDTWEITMPMESGKMVLFPLGISCDLVIFSQGNIMNKCTAVIKDRYKKDGLFFLIVKISSKLTKIQRREFFRVSLDEIKDVVKNNFDKTVEFVDVPDADQYRISLKLREEEHQE